LVERERVDEDYAFNAAGSAEREREADGGATGDFQDRPCLAALDLGETRDPRCEFTVTMDVVEPMGMETMVFFAVNGTEICGRVEPTSASGPGQPMRLYANVNHMHLIDPATDQVL